jgi:hexosaminidase
MNVNSNIFIFHMAQSVSQTKVVPMLPKSGRARTVAVLAAFGAFNVASAQTALPRLLPAPQSIQYTNGSLDASELCAAPSRNTSSAFALKTLADGLHAPLGRCTRGKIEVTLEQTANLSALPMPGDVPGSHSREAYDLTVAANGVHIRGASSAAIFYGVVTLLQLLDRAQDHPRLPFVTIHDWPALAFRATLVDAGSEGPMLTMDQVKRQIDLVARFKGNQYFFYSEGNIELRGYPLLNPEARFTQAQIRGFVAYAAERHIDVIPAVEMYAHLHDLFRIEQYSALADFPHGTQFNPANPKVKQILADWTTQLAGLFPSPFVDIGFDETWSLQKAAANDPNATPVKLFLDQLTTVTQLFQARGKTVMAYADIMVKFPGIITKLPHGLIALPWWYDPIGEPEYNHWLRPLVEAHVPLMVTSGVTSWDQITPNYTVTFANIGTFLEAGQRAHSMGLVNTLWTDDGQTLLAMSWPGVAYGAAAAWQSAPMDRASFFADYARLEYPSTAAAPMASALTELAAAEDKLESAIGRESMLELWRDPFRKDSLQQTEAHSDDLREARLHAEAALTQLSSIPGPTGSVPQLETWIAGARMIDLAGEKFLYANEIDAAWKSLPAKATREQLLDVLAQGISNETHSRCMDLMDGFSGTSEIYRDAWLQQYTPYRLGTATGRWDAEFQYWLRVQTRFENLRHDFKTGDTLPTLQQMTSGG